ncbi:kinase [Reticulibacter mediterranei]|uniref:Kinase n=1 Tax=Reticulibacter mediterranei TaxID=2778369 RepID=A0A8J3J158_9CHLR|nr:AAA family ATPase [Reticulibacter mediterranei]GHP00411.1 kinase [Reticulibacter mediterranei]
MQRSVSTFQTMLDDLTQIQAFPVPVSTKMPITLIQTHASAVVLTHEYVYKIKKPMNFEFFDYSTSAQRRFFCQQEVRLNAPFAPGVYLRIAPIVSPPRGRACFGPTLPLDRVPFPGDNYAGGEIIDFAVVMKRLPDTATLEARVQADTLDVSSLSALARFVAAFHTKTPTNEQIAHFGSLDVISANWEENFSQIHPFINRILDNDTYEQMVTYVHAFLKHRTALFAQRIGQGRIRDCHGDLRLQHVYLLNKAVDGNSQSPAFVLLDRIEFNERFRYSDVASEIAFLTMEIEAAGRADLARSFTQAYVDATSDHTLQELLPFYQCYRACVRGKVMAFLLDESEISTEQRLTAEQQARTLFALAAHYARTPVQPAVVMVGGLMGTGKSTVTHALQQTLGWSLFSSDEIRKHLALLAPAHPQAEAFGQGIYGPIWTEQTYQALHQKAGEVLAQGRSVLLDASFLQKANRQAVAEVARTRNAAVVFVECRCDQPIALERLATRWQRRMTGAQMVDEVSSASDGRPALYEAQKAVWESVQPDESPGMKHILVNTASPLPRCLELILETCGIARLACPLSGDISRS